MEKLDKLIAEARHIHDELELQLHLMNMDLKDNWHELSDKLKKLEKNIEKSVISSAEELGKSQELFYAGSAEELEKLIKEFRQVRDSHNKDS